MEISHAEAHSERIVFGESAVKYKALAHVDDLHNETMDQRFNLMTNLEIDKLARFISDEYLSLLGATRLLEEYQGATEEQKDRVRMGTILTDIGKTGPADAPFEEQKYVLELYCIEGVKNGSATPIEAVLEQHFPDDWQKRATAILKLMRTERAMMSDFWNAHTDWGIGIMAKDSRNIPPLVMRAVALHHAPDGVHADAIGEGGRVDLDKILLLKDFPGMAEANEEPIGWPEKLIIACDKYFAVRCRQGKGHREALGFVQGLLFGSKSPFKDDDPEFKIILERMEKILPEDLQALREEH